MDEAALLRGTYSSALGKAMLGFAVVRGFDPAEILTLMQASRAELDDPDARLPVGPAAAFWRHVTRKLDDPAVPIQFAELLSATDFGVVGFAAMTAPSAAVGLRRAARYYEVIADTARIELTDLPEGIRVDFVRAGERTLALRIMNENSIACVLQVVRSVTRTRVSPLRVAFRHPAPRDTTAHQRFFGAPIAFEADWDGLVVPHGLLERVPPMSDAKMDSFFERHVEEVLGRMRAGTTLTDRVRASIAQELTGGEPQIASVARRLGASARTLRRHLEAEDVTFRALVDDVRRGLAIDYLERGKANVTEVAYLLGFSEVSAFSRAFRRWYGKSPRAYRR